MRDPPVDWAKVKKEVRKMILSLYKKEASFVNSAYVCEQLHKNKVFPDISYGKVVQRVAIVMKDKYKWKTFSRGPKGSVYIVPVSWWKK